MNEAKLQALVKWAKRIEYNFFIDPAVDLRATDIVHDVAGIMRDDEHFVPRL